MGRPAPGEGLTVGELADWWLEMVYRDKVSVDTWHKAEERLPRIKKAMGHVVITDLSYDLLTEWKADLLKELAPSTVRNYRQTMALILDEGVKRGLMQGNPMRIVEPPARVEKEQPALTSEQVHGLPPRKGCRFPSGLEPAATTASTRHHPGRATAALTPATPASTAPGPQGRARHLTKTDRPHHWSGQISRLSGRARLRPHGICTGSTCSPPDRVEQTFPVGWEVDMTEPVSEQDPFPRREWDEKQGAFVPMCPRCTHTLTRSYGRFTCNMHGYSHFKANVDEVLHATRIRLAIGP